VSAGWFSSFTSSEGDEQKIEEKSAPAHKILATPIIIAIAVLFSQRVWKLRWRLPHAAMSYYIITWTLHRHNVHYRYNKHSKKNGSTKKELINTLSWNKTNGWLISSEDCNLDRNVHRHRPRTSWKKTKSSATAKIPRDDGNVAALGHFWYQSKARMRLHIGE